MEPNFSFNTQTHDYWDIYESIRKYYPIGLERKEGKGIYFQFPGIKKLEEILIENVHDHQNYKERWVKFTKGIGRELKKEIIGTTFGQAPSFSSSIVLERNRFESCMHSKELHFSVSFVGGFFQIYGIDMTMVMEEDEQRGYSSVNVVTTSPLLEFRESFEFVERKLRERYTDYRMVPFRIGQTVIHGLEVAYLDDKNCTINQALFNDFSGEDRGARSTRGDRYYGEKDWRKAGA